MSSQQHITKVAWSAPPSPEDDAPKSKKNKPGWSAHRVFTIAKLLFTVTMFMMAFPFVCMVAVALSFSCEWMVCRNVVAYFASYFIYTAERIHFWLLWVFYGEALKREWAERLRVFKSPFYEQEDPVPYTRKGPLPKPRFHPNVNIYLDEHKYQDPGPTFWGGTPPSDPGPSSLSLRKYRKAMGLPSLEEHEYLINNCPVEILQEEPKEKPKQKPKEKPTDHPTAPPPWERGPHNLVPAKDNKGKGVDTKKHPNYKKPMWGKK
jgi:hypothetical protein